LNNGLQAPNDQPLLPKNPALFIRDYTTELQGLSYNGTDHCICIDFLYFVTVHSKLIRMFRESYL